MAVSVRKFSESLQMASPLFTRIRSHRHYPLIVVGFLILAVACLHTWQRVVVMQLVQEVGELNQERRRLTDESKKVESDITRLSSASRIEMYAADSLGLEPVTAERLITLVRDDDVTVDNDEIASMLSSINRVAEFLPSVSLSEANAHVLNESERRIAAEQENER